MDKAAGSNKPNMTGRILFTKGRKIVPVTWAQILLGDCARRPTLQNDIENPAGRMTGTGKEKPPLSGEASKQEKAV